MLTKNFLLFLLSFLLFSCSADKEILIDNSLRSDKIIYNEAANLLNNGKYEEATELFTELDLQHPYSKWATKGQLMSGFALYKNNQYEESIFALSKFIIETKSSFSDNVLIYTKDNCNWCILLKAL